MSSAWFAQKHRKNRIFNLTFKGEREPQPPDFPASLKMRWHKAASHLVFSFYDLHIYQRLKSYVFIATQSVRFLAALYHNRMKCVNCYTGRI
jgi:hypothetical protein